MTTLKIEIELKPGHRAWNHTQVNGMGEFVNIICTSFVHQYFYGLDKNKPARLVLSTRKPKHNSYWTAQYEGGHSVRFQGDGIMTYTGLDDLVGHTFKRPDFDFYFWMEQD